VTQADIDAGSITNVANATGTGPTGTVTSPDSTATVPAIAAITVGKSANPTTFSGVGQTITYTYEIQNTGNVDLSLVTLSDNKLGAIAATCSTSSSGPFDQTLISLTTPLAPNATVFCQATHVTDQADVDAGSIVNTAIAMGTSPSGTPEDSPPSSVTVPGTGTLAMSLVKSANPPTFTEAGQTITYSFKVSNVGTRTLNNIKITDMLPGLSPIACGTPPVAGQPPGPLAPGATETCTATYTTTSADINRGTLANTATATATAPNGDPASPSTSSSVIPAVVQPPPGPSTPGPSTPGPSTPRSPAAPAASVSPITPTQVQVTG
jgi:uncharacterized repeat protein (TIGR01451 family)